MPLLIAAPPVMPPLIATPPASVTVSEDEIEEPRRGKTLAQTAVVFLTSFVLHTVAIVVMAFIFLAADSKEPLFGILSSIPEPAKQPVDFEEVKIENPEEVETKEKPAEIVKKILADTKERFEIDVNDLAPSANITIDPNASAPSPAAPYTGVYGGRSKAGRAALVARNGGSKESEGAVRAGLEWLARHQNEDGSWSFDHRFSGCSCKQPGSLKKSHMGATAMALLSFLGAGHTYSDGDFQPQVERGLVYLLQNVKMTKTGADLRGNSGGNGGMYIQGLATIVLCEALSMNEAMRKAENSPSAKVKRNPKVSRKRRHQVTRQLAVAAKRAVYFIVNAQSSNGGWRYRPRSGADTSVVGWQVMALASAHSAKIRIPPLTVRGASRYLDSVQSYEGARYGYTKPKPKLSMTAVGLLSRIYLGWKRGHPGIRYGVQYLSQMGPSKKNMYYNYYATQVMHQYGGPLWRKWNNVMRDQLVNSQRKKGHAKGSWDVTDPHGRAGGRLYQTCLCVMSLEVYYRHLPLYQHRDLETKNTQPDQFAKSKKKGTGKKGAPMPKSPAPNPKKK